MVSNQERVIVAFVRYVNCQIEDLFLVFTDMINIPWEDVLLITRVSAEIAEAILEADCGNPLLLDEAAAEAA